jgi:hypothetical protein
MGVFFKTNARFFRYIIMKILIDTSDAQTLTFIPRFYPTVVDYTIVEEGTGREVTKESVSASEVSGFLQISDKFLLQSDKFYSVDIRDAETDAVIFRDKIFVTNQDVREYSINDGIYVEDDSKDNTYIIYGEDITPPDTLTLTSVTIES